MIHFYNQILTSLGSSSIISTMPTSSKRGTCQERRLYNEYMTIFSRLYCANLRKQANLVTEIFSNLLECPQEDIRDEMETDQEVWHNLVAKCKGKSQSDNVLIAADAMADAAGCLLDFGRKKEGDKFCEYADDMRNLANTLYQEELEIKERRGRRDSIYMR